MAFLGGEGGKECRICFEAGPGLIAPCKCSGSSKWVHRRCLDQWRCTGPDPAFTRCNTCLFQYRHTAKPTRGLSPKQKYKLMVYRDFVSVVMLLLLAIAAVGLVMYGLDLPAGNIPSMMRGIGITTDAGAYTLFGFVMFFAFVGFCACTVKCCIACDASGGGGNDMLFGYYYCYWWDGPCYVNHYQGATTSSSDCCGNPTSQRNSCDCDCQGCGGDLGCGDADCGNDNPLAVLLVVVVVIFAIVGFFYVAFMLSVVFADISRRHAHILRKRAEASSQVVLDLDGRDLDNLGDLDDNGAITANGELLQDDDSAPLLANSHSGARCSANPTVGGVNAEPTASAPPKCQPWSASEAEAVPWEEPVATKEQPWSLSRD